MLRRLFGHWFGRQPATTRIIVGEDGVTTYQVNREVGRGGSAIISEVRDARGDRFALREYRKSPPVPNGVLRELHRAGLRPELDVLRRLEHPGLPSLVDATDYPANTLVVEYVDGDLLSDDLLFQQGMQTHDDLRRFLQLMIQLLDTLQAMYEQKFIYLDLKPENITLRRTTTGTCEQAVIHDTGCMFCIADPWFATLLTTAEQTLDRIVLGVPENLSRDYVSQGLCPGDHLQMEAIYSVGIMLYQGLSQEVSVAHPWVNLTQFYASVPKMQQEQRMMYAIKNATSIMPLKPRPVVLSLSAGQRLTLIDATMQALASCPYRHKQPEELAVQLRDILSGL